MHRAIRASIIIPAKAPPENSVGSEGETPSEEEPTPVVVSVSGDMTEGASVDKEPVRAAAVLEQTEHGQVLYTEPDWFGARYQYYNNPVRTVWGTAFLLIFAIAKKKRRDM